MRKRTSPRTTRRAFLLLAGCAFLLVSPLDAQLVSPGKLATAHAELEGIRNCTSCHQLLQRGIASERCLSCHEPLARRIESGMGYHASLETDDCASCHKDHFGRDFDLRRLDEEGFAHEETGYPLEQSHAAAECRDCHTPTRIVDTLVVRFKTEHTTLDRTFLGLDARCVGCHSEADPHDGQFDGESCGSCHGAGSWEGAERFDHATTAYPLQGRHAEAECASCHTSAVAANGSGLAPPVRYRPLDHQSCSSCHADEHEGLMPGACDRCHSVEGWNQVGRSAVEAAFDHARTAFPLRGAHGQADCALCHASEPLRNEALAVRYVTGTERSSFPRPVAEDCASCHLDAHAGELTDGPSEGACARCHGEEAWSPASFGLDRHASETSYPLTGAHAVTECAACHADPSLPDAHWTFSLESTSCASCHQSDDPHEGIYGEAGCETCHTTAAFTVAGFTHEVMEPEVVEARCRSCHAPVDPHADQFGDRSCAPCHSTSSFAIEQFDHSIARFALDGAHLATTCAACHPVAPGPEGEPFVRYVGVPMDCAGCHTGGGR